MALRPGPGPTSHQRALQRPTTHFNRRHVVHQPATTLPCTISAKRAQPAASKLHSIHTHKMSAFPDIQAYKYGQCRVDPVNPRIRPKYSPLYTVHTVDASNPLGSPPDPRIEPGASFHPKSFPPSQRRPTRPSANFDHHQNDPFQHNRKLSHFTTPQPKNAPTNHIKAFTF